MAPTTIDNDRSVKSIVFQLTESTKPLRISAKVSAVTLAVPTTAGSRAEHLSQFLQALSSAGACSSVPHRFAVYAEAHAVISERVSTQERLADWAELAYRGWTYPFRMPVLSLLHLVEPS